MNYFCLRPLDLVPKDLKQKHCPNSSFYLSDFCGLVGCGQNFTFLSSETVKKFNNIKHWVLSSLKNKIFACYALATQILFINIEEKKQAFQSACFLYTFLVAYRVRFTSRYCINLHYFAQLSY
jgi:hypothetical protein